MDRADFYIGIDKYAKWIGSLLNYGDPTKLPSHLFLSINSIQFEEKVDDFLKMITFGIQQDDGWPHLWQDSQMTDYSYHLFNGKVWCSMMGGQLFDPLVIIGGEDLIAAEKYAPQIKVEYPFIMPPFINDINLNETYCGVFK